MKTFDEDVRKCFVSCFVVDLTNSTVEMGNGLTPDHNHSRPADVLIARWERGSPAALVITVTSPLTPATLQEACWTAGTAVQVAEIRKHAAKCHDLHPLAAETYGGELGYREAQETFSRLASSGCKYKHPKNLGLWQISMVALT